jgi:hypothetical protein
MYDNGNSNGAGFGYTCERRGKEFDWRIDCGKGREKGVRVFSSWNSSDSVATTPDMQDMRLLESPDVPEVTQWQVAMWGWELTNVGEGVPSQDDSLVLIPGLHRTMLKGRVRLYNSSGGTIRDFDIAEGVRFGVAACHVTIDVLMPTGWIAHAGTSSRTLDGLVLDSIIGAWIGPSTTPPGTQILTNTFVYTIAAEAENVQIPIQPGARSVSLYQTGAGAVIAPFWRTVDGGGFGANIGEIVLGGDRRVEHLTRPGPAKVIDTGVADALNARVLTVIWELEM